jgi:hypothetical protein
MDLQLLPAYGRKYATPAAAIKDWNDGKDFRLTGGGPYTSIRDKQLLKEDGYKGVLLLSWKDGEALWTTVAL